MTSFDVKGRTLDVFAREPLWKIGLDYRHGTGHGIGHFLNVHEGTNTHLRGGNEGSHDWSLNVLDLTRWNPSTHPSQLNIGFSAHQLALPFLHRKLLKK